MKTLALKIISEDDGKWLSQYYITLEPIGLSATYKIGKTTFPPVGGLFVYNPWRFAIHSLASDERALLCEADVYELMPAGKARENLTMVFSRPHLADTYWTSVDRTMDFRNHPVWHARSIKPLLDVSVDMLQVFLFANRLIARDIRSWSLVPSPQQNQIASLIEQYGTNSAPAT